MSRSTRLLDHGGWASFVFVVVVGLLVVSGCGGAGSSGGGGGDEGTGGGGGGEDGSGSDSTPPTAPTSLTADPGDGTVSLSWSAVEEGDTYRVYRSETSTDGPAGPPLEVGLDRPGYDDPTVNNGDTYYYRVTAVDAAGNESDASAEASAHPVAVPEGLSATSGNSEVTLTWNAAAGAETYNVYRSTNSTSGTTGTLLASGVSVSEYTDTSAENGTKYYYRVTAVNPDDAESAASEEVERTPFSSPPDQPE